METSDWAASGVGSGRYGAAAVDGSSGQVAGRGRDPDPVGGGGGQRSGETGRQLSVHTGTQAVQHIQGEIKAAL